jgi:hypothetical protein
MKIIENRLPNAFICDQNDFGEYYAYCYIDPRNEQMFYVGKGKNKRYLYHLKEKFNQNINLRKYYKIHKLFKLGLSPKIIKLADGISERKAYDIEQLAIDSEGTIRKGTGNLTNLVTEGRKRKYDSDVNKTIYEKIGIGVKAAWKDPTSGYYDPKFQESLKNRSGEKNPRYGDHRNYIELHGEEKAKQLSKLFSDNREGSDNSNAKRWKLINPVGKEFYVNGTLKKFCIENNLSVWALKFYKGTPFKPKMINNKRFKERTFNTIGWILYEI